jgi:hypothetical protein
MSNGRIIYQGSSLLDGAPIVVVAIGFKSGSANAKTGDMIQTYIIRSDQSPIEATHSGADASVCGDCPHRGTIRNGRNVGRTCYVNLGQGALNVYKTFLNGGYPLWDGTGVNGRMVRLGTYGDPAAVPAHVWWNLLRDASGHTGYTHQWQRKSFLNEDGQPMSEQSYIAHMDALFTYCMASVDNEAEAALAQAKGWRYFRVALPNAVARLKGEAVCPASAEAGRKLKCADCKACSGVAYGMRGSIVIQAHGGFAVMANVRKRVEALTVSLDTAA